MEFSRSDAPPSPAATDSQDTALAHADEHRVSYGGHLFSLHFQIRPNLEQAPHSRRDPFNPDVNAICLASPVVSFWIIRQHQETDIGVEQIDAGTKVALAESLVDCPD